MAAVVHHRLPPSWDGAGLVLAPPGGAPSYALRRMAAVMVVVLALVLASSVVRVAARAVGTRAEGSGPPPAGVAPAPSAPATHVVASGDSYWSIAVSLRRHGDVRAVVDELVDLNRGRALQPGDRVVLPVP